MNILISFRAGLGDFITLTPLFRALTVDGSHRLFLLVNRELKPLVGAYSCFSEVLYVDYRSGPYLRTKGLVDAVKKFRGRVDMTITPLFQSSKFSSSIPILLASRKAVFYYRDFLSQFHHGTILPVESGEPNVLQSLKLLKLFNLEPAGIDTEIPVPGEYLDRADIFLRSIGCDEGTFKVCVAPYVKGMKDYAAKEWGFENYYSLALKLMERFHAKVIFIGSKNEIAKIKTDMPDIEAKGIFLQPAEFDILTVAALIKRCDLLICNDGGLMHVGVAVNVPVVSIWGPTCPERTGYPYKNNFLVVKNDLCKPCRYDYEKCWRPRQICLDIPVEEVFQVCQKEVLKILDRKAQGGGD